MKFGACLSIASGISALLGFGFNLLSFPESDLNRELKWEVEINFHYSLVKLSKQCEGLKLNPIDVRPRNVNNRSAECDSLLLFSKCSRDISENIQMDCYARANYLQEKQMHVEQRCINFILIAFSFYILFLIFALASKQQGEVEKKQSETGEIKNTLRR